MKKAPVKKSVSKDSKPVKKAAPVKKAVSKKEPAKKAPVVAKKAVAKKAPVASKAPAKAQTKAVTSKAPAKKECACGGKTTCKANPNKKCCGKKDCKCKVDSKKVLDEIFGQLNSIEAIEELLINFFYSELLARGYSDEQATELANKVIVDVQNLEARVDIE